MEYLKPKFTVGPPERVTCCEACVYGRGEHAFWCPMLVYYTRDQVDKFLAGWLKQEADAPR